MPRFARLALLVLAASVNQPTALLAQASPLVPLDDPHLPFIEYLITRGDLADPSPFLRPFRRDEIRSLLQAADAQAGTPSGAMIGALQTTFSDPDGKRWWRVKGRAGVQLFSDARRDPLHPAGPGGLEPYADLQLSGVVGPALAVVRPAFEPRIEDDPDWTGGRNLSVPGRFVEAYVGAQFRWVSLYFGRLDRNWGPLPVAGIPISNYGYGRPGFDLEIRTRDFSLSALASDLQDQTEDRKSVV